MLEDQGGQPSPPGANTGFAGTGPYGTFRNEAAAATKQTQVGNRRDGGLALNKPKLDNLANEIWKSAERLRGKFKSYEYQNVILPIIVIRRLECVLLAWRAAKSAEVLAKRPGIGEVELAQLVKNLELNPHQSPFSNRTTFTLRRVYEEDHALLEENFRAYINGFSKNVDDIVEHFNLARILHEYSRALAGPLSALESLAQSGV